MHHGKKFIEEYPEYSTLFYKLYISRELDDWFLDICKKEDTLVPEELANIELVKEIKIQNKVSPSYEIFIDLKDIIGNEGFIISQQVIIKVSKIIPVYIMDLSYRISHRLLCDNKLDLNGSAETLEIMKIEKLVREFFAKNNFKELSYLYDYYDTVFEWKDVPDLEPFNRRFTLGDAVFVDNLDICK
ncbi:hypothetical protein OZL92_23605 [Bacillus sonorensis]|uniref:Uncharacterized protein n=2 Tax=Bacillus sonorensis TaxID=119858 RepID=M5NY17_9BACI|nr:MULTISPECIES: hypothetical protein [Bacillus]ASB90508.1 hypothetical protein S101395_04006 [Bacillus sonorensis]EME72129.1 hypothetical protein BSONL12_23605 [Bacillus sonorensis L12]MBG9915227.1 hypothetical protein [Bacillus sonorensis]MCF7619667.1 hypothetical protein [Bacillus sonorensis]MCY7859254.1 hypothetical protein [Bacillus sonorensis]